MLEKSDLKDRFGLGSWVLRFQSMVAGHGEVSMMVGCIGQGKAA